MSAASHVVSTQVILSALAREMDHGRDLCDRLEALVTTLIGGASGEPLQIALREAQAVDALQQHLDALGAFVRSLNRQGEHEGGFDIGPALAQVTLADLAQRLSDEVQNVQATERPAADAGELHLF